MDFNSQSIEERLKKNEHKPDILKNVEKEIVFSGTDAKKYILYKEKSGLCTVLYDGNVRDAIILSLSSMGSITIGILKKNN